MAFTVSYSAANVYPQSFSFPKTISNYVFDNAGSKIFRKFNQSCKYFYYKYNYNILRYLKLMDKKMFKKFEDYNFIATEEKEFDCFSQNLWITEIFEVDNATPTLYKSLFSKIVRCDIITLYISFSNNLQMNDFKFLTQSGNIEVLWLFETKVMNGKEEVLVEEIFKCIPKACSINLKPCHVNSQTIKELCLQNRKQKIRKLSLEKIDATVFPLEFSNYFMNVADKKYFCNSNSNLKITFINQIYSQEFNQKICDIFAKNSFIA